MTEASNGSPPVGDGYLPAPAWYPQPDGNYRWWDGTAWGPVAPPSPLGDPVEQGRTLSILAHCGAFLGGFLLPLIVLLTEGRTNPFTKHHASEALNFQITFLVAWFALLVTVAATSSAALFFVAFALIVPFYGLSILGAVRAAQRRWWRYPVNIRFVRGVADRTEHPDVR